MEYAQARRNRDRRLSGESFARQELSHRATTRFDDALERRVLSRWALRGPARRRRALQPILEAWVERDRETRPDGVSEVPLVAPAELQIQLAAGPRSQLHLVQESSIMRDWRRGRIGARSLVVLIGARGAAELMDSFGQTAFADANGFSANVADHAAEGNVEPGGLGEANLLTGIDAAVLDHQERCCRSQAGIDPLGTG